MYFAGSLQYSILALVIYSTLINSNQYSFYTFYRIAYRIVCWLYVGLFSIRMMAAIITTTTTTTTREDKKENVNINEEQAASQRIEKREDKRRSTSEATKRNET